MKNILTILVLCCILPACGNSAPGCSDPETKNTVLKIAREKLTNTLKQALYPEEYIKDITGKVTFSLEAIRTKNVNEETGACYCAADLVVSGPNGQNKSPIEYTSELTDNSGEFYITVKGL